MLQHEWLHWFVSLQENFDFVRSVVLHLSWFKTQADINKKLCIVNLFYANMRQTDRCCLDRLIKGIKCCIFHVWQGFGSWRTIREQRENVYLSSTCRCVYKYYTHQNNSLQEEFVVTGSFTRQSMNPWWRSASLPSLMGAAVINEHWLITGAVLQILIAFIPLCRWLSMCSTKNYNKLFISHCRVWICSFEKEKPLKGCFLYFQLPLLEFIYFFILFQGCISFFTPALQMWYQKNVAAFS